MKRNSDNINLATYMKMLLDGDAFSENKPDTATRKKLVEAIMKDKQFINQMHLQTVQKIKNKRESELKRMLSDMLIKEEEFLV